MLSEGELQLRAESYKHRYVEIVFERIEGDTFITNISIEVNGYGTFRVLHVGKVLYTGTSIELATTSFNEAVKSIRGY